MEYCLAVALLNGEVVVGDFTPAAVMHEPVRAFFPRIHKKALPELTGPPSGGFEPETVTVDLADGRSVARTISEVRGSLELPLTEAELLEKFDSCVEASLSKKTAELLKQSLLGIVTLDDIHDLTRHLPTG